MALLHSSRIKFKHRNGFLKLALVYVPWLYGMIAVCHILKHCIVNTSCPCLGLLSWCSTRLLYCQKFFDTIPYSLDESAMIDGATRADIFFKNHTSSFKTNYRLYSAYGFHPGPWIDFIFAKVILGDATSKYTVAIGLFSMLQQDTINDWFMSFTTSSVIITIPITLLFMFMQKYYVEGITGGSVK